MVASGSGNLVSTLVLHVSRFTPDQTRMAEFLACLWQGDVPADLKLVRWLYVGENPRGMVLLWEGDDAAAAYVETNFGAFGELHTEDATDSTPGLQACFDRDLEAFGAWLRSRGSSDDDIATQLDVRRRGLQAESQEAAAEAGRAWAAEQASS